MDNAIKDNIITYWITLLLIIFVRLCNFLAFVWTNYFCYLELKLIQLSNYRSTDIKLEIIMKINRIFEYCGRCRAMNLFITLLQKI